MKVEQGSNLESILIRQRTQIKTMKDGGFGGDTTLIDTFGDIRVTTKPNGKATIQLGKKAKPIDVFIQTR